MIVNKRVTEIKQARRESLIMKEISELLLQLASSVPHILKVNVTKVILSPDLSLAKIYLFSIHDQEFVKNIIEDLKLYRRSMKASLAQRVDLRRVPDIRFYYDEQQAKVDYMEKLIDSVDKE